MSKTKSQKRQNNQKRKLFFFIIICLIFVATGFFVPHNTHAAFPWTPGDTIIPCGKPDQAGTEKANCTPCDIVYLVKNIIEFIMTAAGMIAVINIIIGGVMYIIGPANIGDPNKKGTGGIDKAKRTLTYTVTGFMVVALAWVIMNTFVFVLGYSNEKWNEIDCGRINDIFNEDQTLRYICNHNTQACEDVGAGNGIYSSESDCAAACGNPTPTYDCDPWNGQCYLHTGSGLGLYDENEQDKCNVECEVRYKYKCVNGACENVGVDGDFDTDNCDGLCGIEDELTYYCDENNECQVDGTGAGDYTDIGVCRTACRGDNICDRPADLAAQNHVPYPKQNSAQLTQMMDYIRNHVDGNLGSIFTYETTNALCNYTRGQPTCGSCAHSVSSCHYGGEAGSDGAEAIDYGNENKGLEIIAAAKAYAESIGRPDTVYAICENADGGEVPSCKTSDGANHVHVSTPNCDKN